MSRQGGLGGGGLGGGDGGGGGGGGGLGGGDGGGGGGGLGGGGGGGLETGRPVTQFVKPPQQVLIVILLCPPFPKLFSRIVQPQLAVVGLVLPPQLPLPQPESHSKFRMISVCLNAIPLTEESESAEA